MSLLLSKTKWLVFPAPGLVNTEVWLVASSIWGWEADALSPTTSLVPLLCLLKPQPESFITLTQPALAPSAVSHKAQSSSRVPMHTAGKRDVRRLITPFPLMRLSHPLSQGKARCHSWLHPGNVPLAQSLTYPEDKKWAMRTSMLELCFLASLNSSHDPLLEEPPPTFS